MVRKMVLVRYLKQRKAEMTVATIIAFILAIVVLIAAITFLISPQILEKLRNLLPGAIERPDVVVEEIGPDELRLLKYDYIGKVKFEEQEGDWVRHYYIYLFDDKALGKEECEPAGYESKEACYDKYGLFKDVPKENCKSKGGEWGFACFNKLGRLIKNTEEINTKIYWNWDAGDEAGDSGKLMLSKSGKDIELGAVKRDFFSIDLVKYEEAKSALLVQGFNGDLLNNLNKAKYISGGIYKYDFSSGSQNEK